MFIVNIIVFVLVIGLIILVHEVGHLIFAKKYGVYCPEFSIGMGPKIYSKKFGETEYCIRAFPIGGFVQMAGEEDDGLEVEEGRRLFDISKQKQAMIMFAGAFFNFILGFVLILIISFSVGVMDNTPTVGEVIDDSIASTAGVSADSVIESVNGETVSSTSDAIDLVSKAKKSGSVEIVFDNEGKKTVVEAVATDESTVIGITYKTTKNPINVIISSGKQFGNYSVAIVQGLGSLFTNLSEAKDNVGGPISIYKYVGDARSSGLLTLLSLTSVLSINIGIFNLLPFPALDGSKIIIALGEWITKRDLPRKLYIGLSVVGFIVLISLMIAVTLLDITKL